MENPDAQGGLKADVNGPMELRVLFDTYGIVEHDDPLPPDEPMHPYEPVKPLAQESVAVSRLRNQESLSKKYQKLRPLVPQINSKEVPGMVLRNQKEALVQQLWTRRCFHRQREPEMALRRCFH